jgi:uncharacterized protein (DUF2062 family)
VASVKAPLKVRLHNALSGVSIVLKMPKYILLALLVTFIITGFIVWSLNFELLQFIVIDAPIALSEKLRLMWDVQTGIYTAYSSSQATGIILFGLLFGINAALFTYVYKSSGFKNIPKKSGGAGLVLAVISGGCIACGTSVLAPILATVGAGSSVFARELSNYLNWLGILLILYSIYKLGSIINNTKK